VRRSPGRGWEWDETAEGAGGGGRHSSFTGRGTGSRAFSPTLPKRPSDRARRTRPGLRSGRMARPNIPVNRRFVVSQSADEAQQTFRAFFGRWFSENYWHVVPPVSGDSVTYERKAFHAWQIVVAIALFVFGLVGILTPPHGGDFVSYLRLALGLGALVAVKKRRGG
jgi:hypothetical protein